MSSDYVAKRTLSSCVEDVEPEDSGPTAGNTDVSDVQAVDGSNEVSTLSAVLDKSSLQVTSRVSGLTGSQAAQESDEEYDTDLEIEIEEGPSFYLGGDQVYLEACQQLGVVPASYFLRHARDEDLIMRHHGLGPLGAKALAIPLVSNTHINTLDLEDNWLEDEGARYIADMMKENCYISNLSLANNRIGGLGAQALKEMLEYNSNLSELSLSGNGFTDQDAFVLCESILETIRLNTLDLSHNQFGDGSGHIFGHTIAENESLDELDLSWNQFRLQSAVAVIIGLKNNMRLKKVNLAMNGLGNVGGTALMDCLKTNQVLQKLDISSNRIGTDGAEAIAKGLEQNDTLTTLVMSKNPIGSAGAMMLLKAVNNEKNALEKLILEGIPVNKEFDELHLKIQETRPLMVKHGGLLGDYIIKGPPKKKGEEALKIIVLHLKNLEFQADDAYISLVNQHSGRMPIPEFKQAFIEAGPHLMEEDVDDLMQRVRKGVTENNVDVEQFVDGLINLLKMKMEPDE